MCCTVLCWVSFLRIFIFWSLGGRSQKLHLYRRNEMTENITDQSDERSGMVNVSSEYSSGVITENIVRETDLGQWRMIHERIGQSQQTSVVHTATMNLQCSQQRTTCYEFRQPQTILHSNTAQLTPAVAKRTIRNETELRRPWRFLRNFRLISIIIK